MELKASSIVRRYSAFLHHQSLAWIILAISLILTFFVYFFSDQSHEKRAQEIFQEKSDESLLHFQENIKEYERILKSGVAFLQASDYVSRDEWHQFVSTLDFSEIKALGYTKIIYPDQLRSNEIKMRSEGYPDFSMHPKGERSYYAQLLYIEPIHTKNYKVIGFDNASEPRRRRALEAARDSGKLRVSEGLKIIQQEPSDNKLSVIFFLPHYQSKTVNDSVEKRRKNIAGFVSTPFLVADLIDTKIHNHSSFILNVDDITPNTSHTHLYESNLSSYASQYHHKKAIEIGGRIWQFSFSSTPTFDQAVASNNPIILAIGGLIFDFILFLVLLSLLRSRQKLEERKSALKASESYLQSILNSSSDGIHILDSEGNLIEYSSSFIRKLGYSQEEAANLSVFDWDAKLSEHEVRTILAQMLDEPMTIESIHREKNGNVYEVEINAQPILLNNKRVIYCSARDITERKKQLETLYLTHQMIDSANDMAFIIRIDNGYIEYSNKTAQTMTGYSLEEMRAIGIEGFRRPIKEQDFLDHLQELKTMGRLTDHAIVIRKDGSEFPVEANVRAIYHEGTEYNIAIVRDISENEVFSKKIAKTTMLLKEAQELAKLGSWHLNLLTGELEWSDEIYELFELDPKMHNPTYEGFLNAIHPEDRELVNEAYQHSLNHHTTYNYIHRLLMRDGRIKYVREQGENFYAEDGTPTESRGTVHDITQEIILQEDLQKKNNILIETSNQLQLATQAAGIGIWFYSLKDHTFTVDAKVLELYEMDPKLVNVPLDFEEWTSRCHPEDVEAAVELLQHSVAELNPLDITFRIVVPSGIKHIHSAAIIKYDQDNNPIGVVGTNRDITIEKTVEKSLTTTKDAAERANKIKSDFLANMSHEIRTPLNGVIGLTELLLQTQLDPLQHEYLSKSQTASRALLNVLNNILDYSKIEAHKLTLESTVFNLDDLMSNLVAMLSYKAEQKHLSLEMHIDDSVPRILVGDPLRLQQILSNLTVNALKFTESGYVRITIASTPHKDRDKITFSISDSGIGMSEQEQTALFQPFSQVDTSFTRKYGGSGLGLMITKELVDLMGGEITVESISGEGSTFTFTAFFDRATSDETTEKTTQTDIFSLPNHKQLHLLLVEDNDLNQLVASERLKQMGITCSIANNGLEALEMVQKETFDAILMDMQMPVMDGLTATKEIRKLEGFSDLPIIALSAAVLQDDLLLAQEAGMNDFVAKPIDKIALQNVLSKWLSD